MQVISANEGVYKCDIDELVTITLTPDNPNFFGATYTFSTETSGAHVVTDNRIQFTMTGTFMRIFVVFHFTGPTGSCEVAIAGSNGGNFADPSNIAKTGNVPVVIFWTFQT